MIKTEEVKIVEVEKVSNEKQKFLDNFCVVREDEKIIKLSNILPKTKEITDLDVSGYEDLAEFHFSDGSLTNLKFAY